MINIDDIYHDYNYKSQTDTHQSVNMGNNSLFFRQEVVEEVLSDTLLDNDIVERINDESPNLSDVNSSDISLLSVNDSDQNITIVVENSNSSEKNSDDPNLILNEIRLQNAERLVIAHLNINFIYNKFEALKSLVSDKLIF